MYVSLTVITKQKPTVDRQRIKRRETKHNSTTSIHKGRQEKKREQKK